MRLFEEYLYILFKLNGESAGNEIINTSQIFCYLLIGSSETTRYAPFFVSV